MRRANERRKLKIVGSRGWSPEDDEWQRQALQQQLNALPTLRASAERWGAGLGAILGGAGVGAVLVGPDPFAQLGSPYDGYAKALFFLAAILVTVAMGAALTASVATSRKLFLVTGSSVRMANRQATRSALRRLALSRSCAVLGAGCLFASAGLLYFGPQRPNLSTPSNAIPARAAEPRS